MKIGEKFHNDEGTKFVVQRTYDPNPTLQRASDLRSAGVGQTGEKRLVGRVPGWLIAQWCKEAGVAPDDVAARQEIIRKKLLSGDFNAFRVWGGTF